MAEQLVKIVQTWIDDETGQTTEIAFTYEGGKQTSADAKVINTVPSSVEEEQHPESVGAPKGKLPADFPGMKALDKAAIHTYTQLSKHADDYTAIPGIGDKTAVEIAEAIADKTQKANSDDL